MFRFIVRRLIWIVLSMALIMSPFALAHVATEDRLVVYCHPGEIWCRSEYESYVAEPWWNQREQWAERYPTKAYLWIAVVGCVGAIGASAVLVSWIQGSHRKSKDISDGTTARAVNTGFGPGSRFPSYFTWVDPEGYARGPDVLR